MTHVLALLQGLAQPQLVVATQPPRATLNIEKELAAAATHDLGASRDDLSRGERAAKENSSGPSLAEVLRPKKRKTADLEATGVELEEKKEDQKMSTRQQPLLRYTTYRSRNGVTLPLGAKPPEQEAQPAHTKLCKREKKEIKQGQPDSYPSYGTRRMVPETELRCSRRQSLPNREAQPPSQLPFLRYTT